MNKYILSILLFLVSKFEGNCSEIDTSTSTLNLNAYLSTIANYNIKFRTNFHILKVDEIIPYGYFEDISPIVGHIIFRSKHLDELSPKSRDELLKSSDYIEFCSDHALHLSISPTQLLSKEDLIISF